MVQKISDGKKRKFEFFARSNGVMQRTVIEAECMVADHGMIEFWSNDRIIAIIEGVYPIHELGEDGKPVGVIRQEAIGFGGARLRGSAKRVKKTEKTVKRMLPDKGSKKRTRK